MSTYYDILNLKTNASQAEIKAAYKKLALKYHPDRNFGKKESEEHFKLVFEAYRTLSSIPKRRIYDSKLQLHKPTSAKYSYHEGGLYRSMFNKEMVKDLKVPKPEVFKSKKKDLDFYLFWITALFIL